MESLTVLEILYLKFGMVYLVFGIVDVMLLRFLIQLSVSQVYLHKLEMYSFLLTYYSPFRKDSNLKY